MNETLQYYNEHAADFTADTQQSDMSERYVSFLSRLKDGGHILDLGCGAGRDSAQFLKRGYQVTAVDGSEELCELPKILSNRKYIICIFKILLGKSNLTVFGRVLHCCIAP